MEDSNTDCNHVSNEPVSDACRAAFDHVPTNAPVLIELPRRQPKLAFVLNNTLSKGECEALMGAAEKIGFRQAGLGGGTMQEVNKDVRSSDRILTDDRWLAALLWERVKAHIPVVWNGRPVIGLTERLRFLRYSEGQFFAPHQDGFYKRPGTENCTFLTFQLYLSDTSQTAGGATRFCGGSVNGINYEDADCTPEQGRVLIFQHNVMHEGALVTAGVKYTVRTDIEYGPCSWLAGLRSAVGLGRSPSDNQERIRMMFMAICVLAGLILGFMLPMEEGGGCPLGFKSRKAQLQ